MSEFWEAGPGGLVAPGRIVAVGRWESAPIRRAVRKAKAEGRLIDLTYGHACKWVLFMDSGHVVLGTEAVPGTASDDVKMDAGTRVTRRK
jgi:regulator of extracellular matrix RemA (YlzA/DUF370 family)